MLSLGLPRPTRPVVVLVAVVALPSFAAPVGAAERDGDAPLLERIEEIVARDGPRSTSLLEPLQGLGLLYEENDDLAFALATLEQAVQIVRVNRGLHTLDQVPLVRQIIRIEEELGDARAAWDRQQDLLTLLRRHPNDLRIVPVLHALADDAMRVLDEYLDRKKPPELFLGCFYQEWPGAEGGNCRAGSRKTVVQGMLAEAQRNYADAIGVLLHHERYDSDELRDLELAMLRGANLLRSLYDGNRSYPPPMIPRFLGASSIEPWRSRIAPISALAEWTAPRFESEFTRDEDDSNNVIANHARLMSPYHRGRQSLRRLYEYAVASDDTLLRQVDGIVQLADWDLLYSRNGRAIDTYSAAYGMLAEAAAAPAAIEGLFAPQIPVMLPAFVPNPLANDETRPPTGHIDVAFEITRYGRPRAVEIRGAANAPDDALDGLLGVIKRNRFRPRLADGQFADSAPVLVRHYLYD